MIGINGGHLVWTPFSRLLQNSGGSSRPTVNLRPGEKTIYGRSMHRDWLYVIRVTRFLYFWVYLHVGNPNDFNVVQCKPECQDILWTAKCNHWILRLEHCYNCICTLVNIPRERCRLGYLLSEWDFTSDMFYAHFNKINKPLSCRHSMIIIWAVLLLPLPTLLWSKYTRIKNSAYIILLVIY